MAKVSLTLTIILVIISAIALAGNLELVVIIPLFFLACATIVTNIAFLIQSVRRHTNVLLPIAFLLLSLAAPISQIGAFSGLNIGG